MAKIIPIGGTTCPECEGLGQLVYSCCTGEKLGIAWMDIMMCPVCKEHLGEEDCVTCEGKGWILEEVAWNSDERFD